MPEHRWYLVESPTYDYVEVVIPETGQGPVMQTRDVAVVRATSAQEARWEAARLWERHGGVDCWPRVQRSDGHHPLTGVTTQRWADLDDHLPPDDAYDIPPEPDPSGWRPFYSDLSETADA